MITDSNTQHTLHPHVAPARCDWNGRRGGLHPPGRGRTHGCVFFSSRAERSEHVLTCWVSLDGAGEENGCMRVCVSDRVEQPFSMPSR